MSKVTPSLAASIRDHANYSMSPCHVMPRCRTTTSHVDAMHGQSAIVCQRATCTIDGKPDNKSGCPASLRRIATVKNPRRISKELSLGIDAPEDVRRVSTFDAMESTSTHCCRRATKIKRLGQGDARWNAERSRLLLQCYLQIVSSVPLS